MHAVIKKNKARLVLLALGACFLFFFFGFSESNKGVNLVPREDTSLHSRMSNSSSTPIFPTNKKIKRKKQVVQIKAGTLKKKAVLSKTTILTKTVISQDNNLVSSPSYIAKKEIIPTPIKNLDKIHQTKSEFTSKGSTAFHHPTPSIAFHLIPKKTKVSNSIENIPSLRIPNRFNQHKFGLLHPSYGKNKMRYNTLLSLGLATYVGGALGLYNIWYSKYQTVEFHFFDDRGEWLDMDKVGHFFSAYYETKYVFQAAKWTGVNRKKSLLIGAISSTLIQGTLEVMDGLSSGWGFSKADLAMNTIGTSVFSIQELIWHEQRIGLKYSVSRPNYDTKEIVDGFSETSLNNRAKYLFGTSLAELILKDYNAQTLWLSANISDFIPESRFPKYLNIAFGYGAENLFGGVHNNWNYNNNQSYINIDKLFPRYRQFYLSLDVDLTKIKTKNPLIKTALFVLNSIKIPAPTLEYSQGKFKFIPLHF